MKKAFCKNLFTVGKSCDKKVCLSPEYRSSRLHMFFKLGVLKNFAILPGKHLCWSPFFNKVAGLRSATLLKKRLHHNCFPVNIATFLRTSFFIEDLW